MRKFPVVFFIDPKLPKDVTQITLSYTFFEIPGAVNAEQTSSASDARTGRGGGADGRS
jgi:cytochrome c oxidase assembly protein subunit 11